jgi:hypothetical protein
MTMPKTSMSRAATRDTARDNDDAQNVNVSSSYAGHGTSGVPTVGAGQSPSAVSVGMVINF